MLIGREWVTLSDYPERAGNAHAEAGRRVVVTGIGVIRSVGTGIADFARAIRAGRHGFSPITSFDTAGFAKVMGAEVRCFDASSLVEGIEPGTWGRSSQFAAAAARLAVRDSCISTAELAAGNCGAIMGTTSGESTVLQGLAEEWSRSGPCGIERAPVTMAPANR